LLAGTLQQYPSFAAARAGDGRHETGETPLPVFTEPGCDHPTARLFGVFIICHTRHCGILHTSNLRAGTTRKSQRSIDRTAYVCLQTAPIQRAGSIDRVWAAKKWI
jgi:hypothetical protein